MGPDSLHVLPIGHWLVDANDQVIIQEQSGLRGRHNHRPAAAVPAIVVAKAVVRICPRDRSKLTATLRKGHV